MLNGYYDFLVMNLYLPTGDTGGVYELGEIAWDMEIAANSDTEEITAEISCPETLTGTPLMYYFVDDYYGQPSTAATMIDTTTFGALTNGYSSTPTLSISGRKATITYDSAYKANDGTTAVNYWAIIPVKTDTTNNLDGAILDCTIKWTAKDSAGYTYDVLEIAETDNGPYHIDGTDKARSNYYDSTRETVNSDKHYLNYKSDVYAWKNGEGGDFTV